jgi:D-3-phosphoglycerate dehydrogenase
LLQFDNVVASPHIAGTTHEARRNNGTIAARQILDVLDGKPAPRLLNREAWPAFAKKFERLFGFAPTA